MRHQCKTGRLNRGPEKRARLIKNLTAFVLTHDRIQTTLARAKVLVPHVDRIISLAKRNAANGCSTARISRMVPCAAVLARLNTTLLTRYGSQSGGYTRLWRAGQRRSDRAEIAVVELVNGPWDMARYFERYAGAFQGTPFVQRQTLLQRYPPRHVPTLQSRLR